MESSNFNLIIQPKMLVDRHILGGRSQESTLFRLLALICLVFLSVSLNSKSSSVRAVHQDYDDLSGRGSRRWLSEPGPGEMWREKRDTGSQSAPTTISPEPTQKTTATTPATTSSTSTTTKITDATSTTTTTTERPSTTQTAGSASPKPGPPTNSTAVPEMGANYEARDVAVYLDSHLTHMIHDPRQYFTQQPPLSAISELHQDVEKIPSKSRFAYMMRIFNEFGRKVASRMNMFSSQILALMRSGPDGLGAKPSLRAYVDAMREAFTANEDADIVNGDLKSTKGNLTSGPQTISSLLAQDKDMAQMFSASISKVSKLLALNLRHLLVSTNITESRPFMSPKRLSVLGAALKNGAQSMIKLMSKNDKFKPDADVVGHMDHLLSELVQNLRRYAKSEADAIADEKDQDKDSRASEQMKARGLSDSTGLVGPWNSYLFDGLGTAERVVRVFASLLASIQDNAMKPRFINMYMSQVSLELDKTMSSFVTLLASGPNNDTSEDFLVVYLDDKTLKKNSTRVTQEILKSHDLDKDRLPARCYLAGRRWRLLLRKAMRRFDGSKNTISMLVDRIDQIKARATFKKYGNELDRLCLPRLEVGLKGFGINGEATGETETTINKFPLRQPIEGLNKDEDPFTGGARMGYRIGFMIGYNDKRNQSLEMEGRDAVQRKSRLVLDMVPRYGAPVPPTNPPSSGEDKEKQRAEVDYLARASYRQGLMAGAKRALEIACREGYMATLKVSVRAGMLLPLEAGSSLASLKGSNFAKIAGGGAGRNFVNSYLMDRDSIDEKRRSQLMDVGMAHGSLAGTHIGEMVGSIVGHESALEAYRRSITRGGKVTRAKFHLDEYLAGAKVGFDYGVEEGGHVAQSTKAGSSAMRFFKLVKPKFPSKVSSAFGHATNDDRATTNSTSTKGPAGSRSSLIELPASLPITSTATMADDHWGQDLITPLPDQKIEEFHMARNHTRVKGSFKGTYNVNKEIKRGLERVSYLNLTYDLDVDAVGFSMNDITYLSLSGKINDANVVHGSLIAQNIIQGNKW